MKNLIWAILFISPVTFAGMKSQECLYSDMKSPDIRKGEVKIIYSCDDFPVPESGVEKTCITFYDAKDALKERGLILRTRVNKDSDTKDTTLKFRHLDQDQKIELEKEMYKTLKSNTDVDLKCEADVVYGVEGNKIVKSCSVTTNTDSINEHHQMFAEMATGSKIQTSLIDYQAVKIEATSWKKEAKGFPKGLSIERWQIKNKKNDSLCLLEVSGKFEVSEDPKIDLSERLKAGADEAMSRVLTALPDKRPVERQGNKTGQAIEFARSP